MSRPRKPHEEQGPGQIILPGYAVPLPHRVVPVSPRWNSLMALLLLQRPLFEVPLSAKSFAVLHSCAEYHAELPVDRQLAACPVICRGPDRGSEDLTHHVGGVQC